MTSMCGQEDMDERVIALEEKVAYLEKALDELSAVVYDVSKSQDRVARELRDLRSQAGPTGLLSSGPGSMGWATA